MPFLTEIAFLIVHWTIHSFGVTLLSTTKLAPFISRMALLLLLFLSLLSFSFFATSLPPEILAFIFSLVGPLSVFMDAVCLLIRAGNVESFIECEGFLSQKLPFCTLFEKAND